MAYNQDSLDTDIVILSDPDSDNFLYGAPVTSALRAEDLPGGSCHFTNTETNIQPASHHALSCAYIELKRRFNDLESKFRIATRHLKSEKNLNAIMASRQSPHIPGHDTGAACDQDMSGSHITNGDLVSASDYCRVILERDDLRRELDDWKRKYEELDHRCAMNVQKETQMSQIWERIHGRNTTGSVLERHQLNQLNQENEHLRLELQAMEQRLLDQSKNSQLSAAYSQSVKHIEEQAHANARKQKEIQERLDASCQRYERLNEEMYQLRNDLRRHQTLSSRDHRNNSKTEDFESMSASVIYARQEMVQLKKLVGDQQEIIQLLLSRLRTDNVARSTNCPAGKQDALTGSQGGLSHGGLQGKLNHSDLEMDYGQVQQCTDDNSTKHSDLHAGGDVVTKHAFLPSSNSKCHTVSCTDLGMEELLSSTENSYSPNASRTTPQISRSVGRYGQAASAMQYELEEFRGGSLGYSRLKGGKLRWSADDAKDEARHDYDDLTFGSTAGADKSGVAGWSHGEITRVKNIRQDIDSPHNDSEEMDLYGKDGGGAVVVEHLGGGSVGSALGVEGVDQPKADGSEIENRYRPMQSGSQPRPLNIERNDCESFGSQSRSHDNTTQNVNINTGVSRKYQDDPSSAPRPTYLNNDPLVGHKTIPNRNIFLGELQEDTLVGPVVGAPRQMGEVADGSIGRSETRSCPVCSETFPDSVPMGQFQQHVLDCVGPPSPPQEERACPVCNTVFPEVIAQAEFEAHVNNHFPEEHSELRFEIIDP